MVQRLRLCRALQVRALRVALLHAQVLRGARGDALPEICGLSMGAGWLSARCDKSAGRASAHARAARCA